MNHSDALQTFAAERYLLNELSAPEREAFEEHYFECQECAMDVRAASAFIGQARRELESASQSEAAAKRRSFFSVFSLPLAGVLVACMAAVVIYQNLVTLPKLRGEIAAASVPGILPVTSLIGGASRAEGELPAALATPGQPLFFRVDVPSDDKFASYELTIYDPAGLRVGGIHVSTDQAKNTLLIRLPASDTHLGIYTLTIEGLQEGGKPAVKLAQYRFRVLNAN